MLLPVTFLEKMLVLDRRFNLTLGTRLDIIYHAWFRRVWFEIGLRVEGQYVAKHLIVKRAK